MTKEQEYDELHRTQPGYLMLDKNVLPYFNYKSNTPYSLW